MRESTVVSWSSTHWVSRGGGFTVKAEKDGNKHGMKVVITVRYFKVWVYTNLMCELIYVFLYHLFVILFDANRKKPTLCSRDIIYAEGMPPKSPLPHLPAGFGRDLQVNGVDACFNPNLPIYPKSRHSTWWVVMNVCHRKDPFHIYPHVLVVIYR